MNQEIERKFLVKALPDGFDRTDGVPIDQGYLAVEPHGRQVRLRRKADAYYITVKGAPNGFARAELEVELSASQFDALWPLTRGHRLRKTRHELPLGSLTVEVDVYGGLNEGLLVVEVEFPTEAEAHAFVPPAWFGRDVSADSHYSNRILARE